MGRLIDKLLGRSGAARTSGTARASGTGPAEPHVTDEFRAVMNLLESGASPVFVTGSAGTGKSTLLSKFREKTTKNVVVVAPTGMAAVNVRGMTIHAFFKFPPKLLMKKDIEINRRRLDVFKKLDTLIIDEVSMVRADLLDAIDVSLRLHRGSNKPFGGVQVVLFGDIGQLPPVVRGEGLESYFSTTYDTPYFFSAHVMKETGVHVMELTTIFRQSDTRFKDLLNRVRHAEATTDDLIEVNARQSEEEEELGKEDPEIILTTTNESVRKTNKTHLENLAKPEFQAEARVEGEFREEDFPAEKLLVLRKGAHVMMLKNNGSKWVNGSLGKVIDWEGDAIRVKLKSGTHAVEREEWDVIDYLYNGKTKTVEEVTKGRFTQFPLKLAWAITIHKSQGQTFDKVRIDLHRGAFAHGQLYVALSRCRSLEGIRMSSPASWADMCFDERIRWFVQKVKEGGRVALKGGIRAEGSQADRGQSVGRGAAWKSVVESAMTTGSRIAIQYVDFEGNESRREVTPQEWVDEDMFSAYCHVRKDKRQFRLSRITSAELVSDG